MAYDFITYQIANCTSRAGEDIDVYIKHASDNSQTALTMGVNPGLRIEWGDPTIDIFTGLRESYCELSIVGDATSDSFLADLDTAEDGEYLLVINRDSSELWRGFVRPELGGRFQRQNAEISIKASSGFAYLQGKSYPTVTSGRVTVLSVIDEALQELGYALPYTTDNDIYPDNISSSLDVLANIYVDRSRFQRRTKDGELAVMTCYDVLWNMATRFGLMITQYGGRWYIQHWPQYQSGDTKRFLYNTSLVEQSTSTAAHTVSYDGSTFDMISEFPFIYRKPPYGEFEIEYNHDTDYSYYRNGGFSSSTASWADNWTKAGSNQSEITLVTDGIAPETPNEIDWNNNSVKINAYYDPAQTETTPNASIPYFYQLSKFDIPAFDPTPGGNNLSAKFRATVKGLPSPTLSTGRRGNHRWAWWRWYSEATTPTRMYFVADVGVEKIDFDAAAVTNATNRFDFDRDTGLSGIYECIFRIEGGSAPAGLTNHDIVQLNFQGDYAIAYDFSITTDGAGDFYFEFPNGNSWTPTVSLSYNTIKLQPNEVLQMEYEITRTPYEDQYYLEFYGVADSEVEAFGTHGGTPNFNPINWRKPVSTIVGRGSWWQSSGYTKPDILGVLFDGVYFDDDQERSSAIRTTLTTTERTNEYPSKTLVIGEGPWGWSDAAITISTSEWKDAPAENWDGLGFSDLPLDEFWLKMYAKYLGDPRITKRISFRYNSAYATPVDTLTVSSVRYAPLYFWLNVLDTQFGGDFVKITSASNTVTVTEYDDKTVYRINGPTGVTSYNALSELVDHIGLITDGEIQLGTGTVNTDFTGIRIYKDTTGVSDVYRVSGWNNDVVQAYLDSDGKFYAGGGNVILDEDGLYIEKDTGTIYDPVNGIPYTINFGNTFYFWATERSTLPFVPELFIWSDDVDGRISINAGSTSGDVSIGSVDSIILSAGTLDLTNSTTIDVGTATITDSNDSTGSLNYVLSQDAGGVVWRAESTGGFTNLTLAGTSGTPQTISDTDTITIAAGTGITTTAGATDTVTVAIASGGVDTTQLADNAVTVAKLAHSTANHVVKMDGSGIPTTGTVATANIADDAVTVAKVSPTGGSEGQVIGISSGNPAWITPASGFTSISLAGTSGTPQTINETDTITIAAGTGITTTAGATDTVTVAIASLGVDTAQLADNAVTSAKIAHSTANHIMYFNGTGVPTTGFLVNDNITAATIQYGKLSPTGGSEGNVLSISGGNVAWVAPSTGGTMDDWNLYINGSPEGVIADAGIVDFRNNSNLTWTWNDTTKALEATVSGLMANFTAAGTSGTPQTISNGNTLTIAAGTGISTTAAATDTITIANTGIVSLGWGIDGGSPYTVTSGDTLELAEGTGISMSQASGVITINANGLPTTIDLQTTGSTFDDMEHEGTTNFVGANFSNDSIVYVKGHVMATTQTADDHAAFKFEAVVEVSGAGTQTIKWQQVDKLYDTTATKLQLKLVINTDFSVQVANITVSAVTTNWKGQFTAQELARF